MKRRGEVISTQCQRLCKPRPQKRATCAHRPALLRSAEKNVSKDHLSWVSCTLAQCLDTYLQLANLLFQVFISLNELNFQEFFTLQEKQECFGIFFRDFANSRARKHPLYKESSNRLPEIPAGRLVLRMSQVPTDSRGKGRQHTPLRQKSPADGQGLRMAGSAALRRLFPSSLTSLCLSISRCRM